ncbi:MAG: glycosyltransferase family 2 protein [Candidatus Cloacimonetes bacterium]|jgi:glycosyltransferase involved in cell wall biosynthesis|nr:glycosyltransferase family 2 protein [Candidatus Cloacimonadota bacterium]MDD4157050.1 glycosyltransferase family 2 protein [Candidatus Cloacimonadota bacterium]
MKISFVIPVFNEAESLQILYQEIIENIVNYDYEIIFIDDGSIDNSFEVLNNLAHTDNNLKIIKFRRNFGKSAALYFGFQYCTGDIVFTMDADLQDNPQEIPTFIEKINLGWDLVTGWKKKRKDPISKTLPSKFFNFITSKTFNLKLHDYNCGFKAYKREVINELDIYGEMHRYIPALAIAKGFSVTEIEVNHRERRFGKSKFGFERYLRGFLDLMTVKLVTTFNRSPLYLFGGIGTIISGLGIFIALYLTIMRFMKLIYLTNRPLLFLSILLIIVGLQFISIGLIGELLVNQSRKLNNNNTVSIKSLINFKTKV